MALTDKEIKLKCADIAITNGTKIGIENDACLDVAKKIYRFVIGTSDESAPETNEGTG